MFFGLVLFVGLYAVLSGAIIRQLEDERFTYRENFVWAVFQIQRQLFIIQRDIEAAFGRAGLDDQAVEDIMLEYEIMVSRVFLLRDGEGFRVLFSVPEVAASIDALQNRIDEVDIALEMPRIQGQNYRNSIGCLNRWANRCNRRWCGPRILCRSTTPRISRR